MTERKKKDSKYNFWVDADRKREWQAAADREHRTLASFITLAADDRAARSAREMAQEVAPPAAPAPARKKPRRRPTKR